MICMVCKQFLALSDSASLFTPSWKPPLLLNHLLALAARETPRILYVGAAKGDNPQRIAEFFSITARAKCSPRVLSFFDLTSDNPGGYFSEADIIFIDGGSTRNLLAILREWDAVVSLRNAYERGVLVAGASAGASIFFDWCMTDSVKTEIRPLAGLGILRGAICVHHNVRKDRRVQFQRFLKTDRALFPAYALDDGVALHFVNNNFAGAFSLTPSANCWRVEIAGGEKQAIKLSLLGDAGCSN
jgi:peptidase E